MNLEKLKENIWRANQELVKYNLVTLTWGNVSGFDRRRGLVVIKPSGVDYQQMNPSDMMVVDIEGKIVQGSLSSSSDTPTHLEIYRNFREINGITHTHSEYAAMFAQAGLEIPCLGTTHADYFNGPVPLTRFLREEEVKENYEQNTGKVIVERFQNLNPSHRPGVLVAGHGPFTWGQSASESVKNSLVLEKVAQMAWGTLNLNPQVKSLPSYLLKKHYQRKHGPHSYYGQNNKGDKE